MKKNKDAGALKEKKADNPDIAGLQQAINYEFTDPGLLTEALIHSSYANELNARSRRRKNRVFTNSNERLEFLGDSALSLVTSEYIFQLLRHFPEGDLSQVRAAVVCENALYEYAKMIDLGKYISLSKGEINSNGRNRKSILADAFEALIGAIYMDGGYAKARKFIYRFIKPEISEIVKDGDTRDYKTMLQRIVQKNREDRFTYRLLAEEGPEHLKLFRVQAVLNNNVLGEGTGNTKRAAEQSAAKEALSLFGVKFDEE